MAHTRMKLLPIGLDKHTETAGMNVPITALSAFLIAAISTLPCCTVGSQVTFTITPRNSMLHIPLENRHHSDTVVYPAHHRFAAPVRVGQRLSATELSEFHRCAVFERHEKWPRFVGPQS